MIETTTLQKRIRDWVTSTFGPGPIDDKRERALRLVEEALELAQSMGLEQGVVLALVGYVYGREPGELRQELGGVMLTALAAAECLDLDAGDACELELARVESPETVAKCRRKQEEKKHRGLAGDSEQKGKLHGPIGEATKAAADQCVAAWHRQKTFTLADIETALEKLETREPSHFGDYYPRPASPSGAPYNASRKHFLEVRYPGNGRDDDELPITFCSTEAVRELGEFLLTMADNADELGAVPAELRLQVALPEHHVAHVHQRLREGLNELACSWTASALEKIPPKPDAPLTDEGHRALLHGRRLGLVRAVHELELLEVLLGQVRPAHQGAVKELFKTWHHRSEGGTPNE